MVRTMHCLTWPTKRVHVASAHVQRKDKKNKYLIVNVLK